MTIDQTNHIEFLGKHPVRTSDGRRWATLACAGHTACHADRGVRLTAVDDMTGVQYGNRELRNAWVPACEPLGDVTVRVVLQ